MTCPNCGKEVEDAASKCPYCGWEWNSQPSQSEEKPTTSPSASSQGSVVQKSYTKLLLVAAGLAFAAIVVLAFLAGYLIGSRKEPSETPVMQLEQQTTITTMPEHTTEFKTTTTTKTTTTVATTVTTIVETIVETEPPTNPPEPETYTVSFSVDEVLSAAGMQVGGAHGGFVILGNYSCSNGTAYANTESYATLDCLQSITVTDATAGTVTVSGTVYEYGVDTLEGEPVTYELQSASFTVSASVG